MKHILYLFLVAAVMGSAPVSYASRYPLYGFLVIGAAYLIVWKRPVKAMPRKEEK